MMKSMQTRYFGLMGVLMLGVIALSGCQHGAKDPDDDLIANEPKIEANNNVNPAPNPTLPSTATPVAATPKTSAESEKEKADKQEPLVEETICWPFDEGQGKEISDSTKNPSYRGTVCGEGKWATPGRVGSSALVLDGETAYVALKNTVVLNHKNQITIAAWIKPDKISDFQNIVVHEDLSPKTWNEMFLRILGGRYQVGIWHASDVLLEYDVPQEDKGVWVHLAGIYDGKCWYLYRNGELVAARKIDLKKMKPFNFPGPWTIGASRRTGDGRYFKGQIEDVRLYNRGLSQVEVQELAGQRPTAAPTQAMTLPTEKKP